MSELYFLRGILAEMSEFVDLSVEFVKTQRHRFPDFGIEQVEFLKKFDFDYYGNLIFESTIDLIISGVTERHSISLTIFPESVKLYSYVEVFTGDGERLSYYQNTERIESSLRELHMYTLGISDISRQDIIENFVAGWFPTQKDLAKFKASQKS